MRFRIFGLVIALGLLAPVTARAGTTVSVNLKGDLKAQTTAETAFKALIDAWVDPGLDVKFTSRPTYSLNRPGTVRVLLAGFKARPNAAWYQRYAKFHAQLRKQPFAREVFAHAELYCSGGATFMQAACLSAGGQVLYRGEVHNMLSMSRAEDTRLFFFVNHAMGPLPAKPPSLAYLAHGTVGDPMYLDVPADVATGTTKIRLEDRPAHAWPVLLGPAPLVPPRTRPAPLPSSLPSPGAAAPVLPAPSL